jgi:signal transduction histidine kinase
MVSGAADPALAAAIDGANRTVVLAAFAAAMLTCGLVLTARGIRANAELTTMQSEFVSSITHELKTPLASIRALGDSLISGRITTVDMQQEYAGLVVQQSKRLIRIVDNLLAHARITDTADIYSFQDIDVATLVNDVLLIFSREFQNNDFHVRVDIPSDLPQVRADFTAMKLVLENIIDNAIRYSGENKDIEIAAAVRGDCVAIRVTDKGIGIPPEDLNRVVLKFIRGRNARGGGSGLGLSIVQRVMKDHGGKMTIDSRLDEGTTVTVELPQI